MSNLRISSLVAFASVPEDAHSLSRRALTPLSAGAVLDAACKAVFRANVTANTSFDPRANSPAGSSAGAPRPTAVVRAEVPFNPAAAVYGRIGLCSSIRAQRMRDSNDTGGFVRIERCG